MADNKVQFGVFAVLAALLAGGVWLAVHHSRTKGLLPTPAAAGLSQQVNIDVYVDGSGSMKNFLEARNTAEPNFLRDFLDNCEDTLRNPSTTGGWIDHPVHFWRFGARVSPIPDGGGLKHLADNPEGYKVNGKLELPGFTESRTSIEGPVNDPSQQLAKTSHPEVKIIITDLYQSDGANVRPSEGLAEQYLKDAGAVAIYGIRSPYSRTAPVEDLPALHGASLPPGAADSMPFYIIVAGDNAADVYHAQETLMNGPTGVTLQAAFSQNRAFVAYFSKHPGWRMASAPGPRDVTTRVEWTDPSNSRKRIGTGDFDAQTHEPIGLLRIREGSGTVVFSSPQAVLVQIDKTNKHLIPIGTGLTVHSKAYVAGVPGPAEDKAAEQAVKAETCGPDNEVCATFNGSRLSSKKGTYLFEFDLIATQPGEGMVSERGLMKTWNIEDAEQSTIAAKGSHAAFPAIPEIRGEHPGRTPRLAEFMQVLQNRVFQVKSEESDPVRIATYDLYVEAR